ncbi:exonuclease [Dickeya phage Katbat]|uniref:Exonuclease n=3 Tax=Aarhusvirus TaxID=2732675 RepID=A0A2S1GSL9_9CAUD|nr:exonuclease [Dickeya phage Dagda]YP_009811897.1 exonuclease [Dickeya phage Katbat]AWD92381.1 exonuclease [Dickeya phage Dagda]AXY81634.1 exonuclease [Dickeya phage Dagda_B1]AXY81746.1 exonuclease [Dickeya phage Katbat]
MSIKTLAEFEAMGLKGKGLLVMDGDWIVFQAMSASEFDESWDEEIWHRCCDHAKARMLVDQTVHGYQSRKKAWAGAPVVLAFTSDTNWRKEVLETYKSNRKKTKKPVGYHEFLEALFDRPEYICVREPNLEGDDVMGIIGSNPEPFGFKKAVLVSCDKDFKTIPNCDFFWCTNGKLLEQNEQSANYHWMYQTLIGDITDGYSGIPGMGKGTASEFLDAPYKLVEVEKVLASGKRKGEVIKQWSTVPMEPEDTMWDAIVTLAAKAGMSREDVQVQAQVARILRHEDYNWIDREIYLPTI